jgi:hypothetical protein
MIAVKISARRAAKISARRAAKIDTTSRKLLPQTPPMATTSRKLCRS